MRIHVALPKPTTVSVDDDLMALLGAALVIGSPSLHADAKIQSSKARRFVREVAEHNGNQSAAGLSLSVQRAIVRFVAAPHALAILDARDSEEAKAKAAAAHLEDCARHNWATPAQIAEKRLKKTHAAEQRKQRAIRAAAKAVKN